MNTFTPLNVVCKSLTSFSISSIAFWHASNILDSLCSPALSTVSWYIYTTFFPVNSFFHSDFVISYISSYFIATESGFSFWSINSLSFTELEVQPSTNMSSLFFTLDNSVCGNNEAMPNFVYDGTRPNI